MTPLAGVSREGCRHVSACLKADGHGLLSSLMYEWVYEADEPRRAEIDRLVQAAAWTTLHRWV